MSIFNLKNGFYIKILQKYLKIFLVNLKEKIYNIISEFLKNTLLRREYLMKKQPKLDANGYRKFGIRDSVAYAAGDLGCNMSFALKGTMAIFWTQFMKMDLWYALLLIIVQVWDAINDPLIGSIIDADKHKYKRNKFLTYIWAGSIGLIVGGACCFLPSQMLQHGLNL